MSNSDSALMARCRSTKECNELAWHLSGRVEELIADLHGSGVAVAHVGNWWFWRSTW